MAKKDFSGGMANLLSGADQSVTHQKPTGAEQPTPEPTPTIKKEPTLTQDELDLINTMEDKEFREELKQRLKERRGIGRGRPRKNDQLGRRSDGYDRTSLIVNRKKWAKIREIALRETLTMKEIVELALDMVISRYEAKHGEVKPQPGRAERDIYDIF